jgi:hypothetical protein
MNTAHNPEVAADKARERYPKGNGQFEALTLDAAFPETARASHSRPKPRKSVRCRPR